MKIYLIFKGCHSSSLFYFYITPISTLLLVLCIFLLTISFFFGAEGLWKIQCNEVEMRGKLKKRIFFLEMNATVVKRVFRNLHEILRLHSFPSFFVWVGNHTKFTLRTESETKNCSWKIWILFLKFYKKVDSCESWKYTREFCGKTFPFTI